jgi:hypothetical protein
MKKIAVSLTLAVAFCFVLASVAQAGCLTGSQALNGFHNTKKAVSIPVWRITQDGTANSVNWVDHTPNPRFAIYDPGTPGDDTDDVVLDKETGFVWERSPSTTPADDWHFALGMAYHMHMAGRKGWRLPTIEELASLVDPVYSPSLPNGHPFINVQPSNYWSSTTTSFSTTWARSVNFADGSVTNGDKLTSVFHMWCVRGGQGHDGY